MKNENLTVKEINEKITELKTILYSAKQREIKELKEKAKKNIGRCFITNGNYAKIIDIPKEEYTRLDINFNQYQYPALIIGHDPRKKSYDYVKFETVQDIFPFRDVIPFYYGTFFYDENNKNHPLYKYTEITPEEFNNEFDRVLKEFELSIININRKDM